MHYEKVLASSRAGVGILECITNDESTAVREYKVGRMVSDLYAVRAA